MPKYRLLTKPELEELENEFVEYLIVNGITADDWVKIKDDDIDKAERIVELFSDVVFEKILRETLFMEFHSQSHVQAFQCLKDKMIVMGLKTEDPEVDFTDKAFLDKAMHQGAEGIKIYSAEQAYDDTRERILFEMSENGITLSDGKLFKQLSLVYASTIN